MAAPKFEGNQSQEKPKEQSKSYRTICKPITLCGDLSVSRCNIDQIISDMEKSGYDYYDHIDQSFNEKILIFKKIN